MRLFSRATPLSDYLSAIRQIQANDVEVGKPRVIYALPEPFPTKAEAVDKLAAAEIDAEQRWLIQERAKEREAMEAHQPKVRPINVRRVK